MPDFPDTVEEREGYGPFPVECENNECEWSNEPGLRPTAVSLKKRHERQTDHSVRIIEPEESDNE